ncbi:MAG: 4a-hydroxytetrahydrobiopterin dehydratase [Candidatus Andersenbacteria bacterium]
MGKNNLAQKHCVPCQGGVPPLADKELQQYVQQLPEGWEVEDTKKLIKTYELPGFRANIAFVNQIADIAEEEDHHPDLHIAYNKLKIELWTHKIGGLHENDFILAAKIGNLYNQLN